MTDWSGPAVDGLLVPMSKIRAWRAFALKNPWQGNQLLTDRRYVIDTTAITEPGRDTRVLLSLDVGYHSSGWWKNSDYEQCLHLSVSHPLVDRPKLYLAKADIGSPEHVGMDLETPTDDEVRSWGDVVFGQWNRWTWLEPAASPLDPYRSPNVVHLRLYLDERLQPILPVGEPYGLNAPPWSEKVIGSIGGDVR